MLDRLNSPGFSIKFEELALFAIGFGSYLKSFAVNYFNYSSALQSSLDVEPFIKTKSILTWILWFIKPCWSHFLIRFLWRFFGFWCWCRRRRLGLWLCRCRLPRLWCFRFNCICICNSPFLTIGPLLVGYNDLTTFVVFLSLDINELAFFVDHIISLDFKHLEPS